MSRICATLLTFTLVGLGFSTEAQAQHLFRKASARQVMTTPVGAPGAPGTTTSPAIPATRSYTYSYYTRSTLPARTYVGYGDNDFPYHGAPYGHPYDPYTWGAMSGSYQAEMSRYYSPPVK